MCTRQERRDLSPLERSRLEVRIGKVVCSEPWQRHAIEAIQEGVIPHQAEIERSLRRTGYYPPGPGKLDRSPVHSPMQACTGRACRGKLYPAYYLVTITARRGRMRLCQDCAERWRAALARRFGRQAGYTRRELAEGDGPARPRRVVVHVTGVAGVQYVGVQIIEQRLMAEASEAEAAGKVVSIPRAEFAERSGGRRRRIARGRFFPAS
jgi:hypothetical protein